MIERLKELWHEIWLEICNFPFIITITTLSLMLILLTIDVIRKKQEYKDVVKEIFNNIKERAKSAWEIRKANKAKSKSNQ